MRKVILLAVLGSMIGACSMAVNDSPRTTPPGKFKMGAQVGSYLASNVVVPLISVNGRYGIAEDLDLGFRLFFFGIGMEAKKSFNQQTAIAFGSNLSIFDVDVYGTRVYDIYGTLIYGFKPTGSTPYIYLKPHFQGYIGKSHGSDTTYTFGESGLMIQTGFGYYGNPDKLIQPSIELGMYYLFSSNPKLTFSLSLGLNFMIGN